jgi:single-strand DNA-binding protein
MYEDFITVAGNIVADPEQRQGRTGPFTTFRLASTPRRRTADGSYADGPTNFYGVCAFGPLGGNALASLYKGQPVIVSGRLRINQYRTENNEPRTSAEIDAYNIGPDLRWGQASFRRLSRAEALGLDRMGDSDVQAAMRELDEEGGRPDNVDENGVVHDLPLSALTGPDGPPEETDDQPAAEAGPFGDPETDDYEVEVAEAS